MAITFKANKKYFAPLLWKPAAVLGIIGIIALFASPVVGVVLIVLAAAFIAFQLMGRSSSAALDAQCREQLAGIKEKALRKLGIDEDDVKEASPIFFDGYVFGDKYQTKVKKEGDVWRSSLYQGTAIFFSGDQVYFYTYTFSLFEEDKTEATQEYFYTDIVSVATQSTSYKFREPGKNKDTLINYEYFTLTTSGGTEMNAFFRDLKDVEKSVNGMKQLVREKKRADK